VLDYRRLEHCIPDSGVGSSDPIRKFEGNNDAKCSPRRPKYSEDPGLTDSAWDPDPGGLRACDLTVFEIDGCKLLLLEILRRAAHDWVLYRSSTRLAQKQIADEAYGWLFREEPGTRQWKERQKNKKHMTSFFSVCDVLSLDPAVVRRYVKELTVKEILSTGRPPTCRKRKEKRPAKVLPAPICELPVAKVTTPSVVVTPVPPPPPPLVVLPPIVPPQSMTVYRPHVTKALPDNIKRLVELTSRTTTNLLQVV